MSNNQMELTVVRRVLSVQRINTYELFSDDKTCSALELYAWNAQISSAFLVPLHFCEVAIRNAASEAISSVYGEKWPWSHAFERSLPNKGRYSQKSDLIHVRQKTSSTGKTIPELKFVFWQKLFTSRFDERLWEKNLEAIFPNASYIQGVSPCRENIYQDLEVVRRLRNRIAHHEPIFSRDLTCDFNTIGRLISYRCTLTEQWMQQHQLVTELLDQRPF